MLDSDAANLIVFAFLRFLWPNRLEDKIGSASETVQSDGKGAIRRLQFSPSTQF